MYLSRIELATQNHNTRRALLSPQILHAAIEGCFPNKATEKERKLWRLDLLHDKLYLLLLSPEVPSLTHFSEQFCTSGTVGETKNYDLFLATIRAGQQWQFRLRGNAVHSVVENKERGVRGKIYAHVTAQRQREWLIKKSTTCGFTLDKHSFEAVETNQLHFQRNKGNPPVIINATVFEGGLMVTDAEMFTQALTHGVGRAKAYGCGLLTIAKPT